MSTAHWQARRLPIPAAWPVRSSPAAHPWAIISAGLAPVLLTGGYLVAGALQPASYSLKHRGSRDRPAGSSPHPAEAHPGRVSGQAKRST